MRCSITPPALTASSEPDVAVVSSSSVTPAPVRASRERPKDMKDVILVKFVLLVSVHTTSVNVTWVSEASKFQVLLCFIVLQVVVFMESRHKDVWSRPSDSQIIPHMFSCSCFKVVWLRGHHHGLPHPLCALRQGQPRCPFPIHDQIQSDYSNEGCDGRQRQVNVDMVFSCRIGTAVLRWQKDVGSALLSTWFSEQ